jgi:hypothetical protein
MSMIMALLSWRRCARPRARERRRLALPMRRALEISVAFVTGYRRLGKPSPVGLGLAACADLSRWVFRPADAARPMPPFAVSRRAVSILRPPANANEETPAFPLGLPVWQRLERGKPNQPFPAPADTDDPIAVS